MSNEQDEWREQQEERDMRDNNRRTDKRESHGRIERLFRGGERISPVPARPSGSGIKLKALE